MTHMMPVFITAAVVAASMPASAALAQAPSRPSVEQPAARTDKAADVAKPKDAAPREPIAVPDLESHGLSETSAKALSDLVRSEVQKLSGRNVISHADISKMLDVVMLKQMMGCNDEKCLGEFRDLLGVEEMVAGVASKVGSRHVLTLRRVNMKKQDVIARVSVKVESEEKLVDGVREAASKLFAVPARLRLFGQVAGAAVFLDNEQVAKLPREEIPLQAEAGRHELRIEHPDYLPYTSLVDVERGKTSMLMVDMQSVAQLQQKSGARRWWGYGSVGGAVAMAALSAVMFVQGGAAYDDFKALDRRRDDPALFDTYQSRAEGYYTGGYVTAVIAAAAAGIGTWLLIDDPYQSQLKAAGVDLGK